MTQFKSTDMLKVWTLPIINFTNKTASQPNARQWSKIVIFLPENFVSAKLRTPPIRLILNFGDLNVFRPPSLGRTNPHKVRYVNHQFRVMRSQMFPRDSQFVRRGCWGGTGRQKTDIFVERGEGDARWRNRPRKKQ